MYHMKRNEDYTYTSSPIEIKSKKDILQMVQYVESSNERKLRLVMSKTVVGVGEVSATPLKLQRRQHNRDDDPNSDDEEYYGVDEYKILDQEQDEDCDKYVACCTLATCSLDCTLYSYQCF